VRENNQYGEKIYYHALLMFNRDAFWRLGKNQKKGSLADLVKCVEAEYRAPVSFAENPDYLTVRRCFSTLITLSKTEPSSTATRYVHWDVQSLRKGL
jgi:hypothetical protein